MAGAIPLRGISLATSERMSLDNQYSYAPVIRGVARTNARLLVRQRDTVIYSTLLTPGAFAIDDLYTAQVGADLDVVVEESDGQIQSFRVPTRPCRA
jgi:outer membrane usher protein